MLPPPTTTAVCTPKSASSFISPAMRRSIDMSMPCGSWPIMASPLSFSKIRRSVGAGFTDAPEAGFSPLPPDSRSSKCLTNLLHDPSCILQNTLCVFVKLTHDRDLVLAYLPHHHPVSAATLRLPGGQDPGRQIDCKGRTSVAFYLTSRAYYETFAVLESGTRRYGDSPPRATREGCPPQA